MPFSPLVIVSDVDGTLLDHRGQWFTAPVLLREQLHALTQRVLGRVIVVLASSRTIDELTALQRCLGMQGPCIGEDGAVLSMDTPVDARAFEQASRIRGDRGVVQIDGIIRGRRTLALFRLGASSATIRQQLRAWPSTTADLACAPTARLAALGFRTGRQQQRALQSRRASVLLDPTQWRANRLVAAGNAPVSPDLDIVRGGRWLTATMGAGKGPATDLLRAYINCSTSSACHVVGIGDGANDQSLLRTVDLAFAVPDAKRQIHPALREIPHVVSLTHDQTAWPEMLTQLPARLPRFAPRIADADASTRAGQSQTNDLREPEHTR